MRDGSMSRISTLQGGRVKLYDVRFDAHNCESQVQWSWVNIESHATYFKPRRAAPAPTPGEVVGRVITKREGK